MPVGFVQTAGKFGQYLKKVDSKLSTWPRQTMFYKVLHEHYIYKEQSERCLSTLLCDIPAEQRKPVCFSTAALISSTMSAPIVSCSSAELCSPSKESGNDSSHCWRPLDLCSSEDKHHTIRKIHPILHPKHHFLSNTLPANDLSYRLVTLGLVTIPLSNAASCAGSCSGELCGYPWT